MERLKTTPRDFFLYVFATGALYFSAVDLIVLLRQYVNYFFPDPLGYNGFEGLSEAMRLSMAFLIVLFPAYVIVMWWLGKDIDREPQKQELWVRRWSLYLTLFLSGVAMVGDLVYLVYSFLGGDFTIRFILQALAILIVSAAVFAYYLFLLRRAPGTHRPTRRALAIASLIIIGALVIGAFFIVGSPAKARARAWDQQRTADLSSIQYQVVIYWQQKEELPANLEALNDPIGGYVVSRDPQTEEPYEYRVTGKLAFELCATFQAESLPMDEGSKFYPNPLGQDENWQHGEGHTCFARTIDPELYPPTSITKPGIPSLPQQID